MTFAHVASMAALLLVGACQAGRDLPHPVAVDASDASDVTGVRDGQTALRVGQTLLVALPSNATTGYGWSVSGGDGGVLTPDTPYGDEITAAHAPGMVGVGGVTHWRFRAVRPGEATLNFAYRRAWEPDAPAAETAVFRLTVR